MFDNVYLFVCIALLLCMLSSLLCYVFIYVLLWLIKQNKDHLLDQIYTNKNHWVHDIFTTSKTVIIVFITVANLS